MIEFKIVWILAMIIHYNYLYDLYIMYIIIIPFNPLHMQEQF